jgi:Zn-finger nucleic acid-binding protein
MSYTNEICVAQGYHKTIIYYAKRSNILIEECLDCRATWYPDTEVNKGTIYKADNWLAVNETKGISWSTDYRVRNLEQSLANKIRWEYKIKDFKEENER